jgi:hypothetical protein
MLYMHIQYAHQQPLSLFLPLPLPFVETSTLCFLTPLLSLYTINCTLHKMLGGNKRSSSSFGADGRRASSATATATAGPTFRKRTLVKSRSLFCSNKTSSNSSSKLFQSGCNIAVQRAPVLNCLTCTSNVTAGIGLQKKFQRPMTKRRAYSKTAEDALKTSSLGVKRRMDGMAKLMARAGRGLAFKLPTHPSAHDGTGTGSDDDSDDDSNDQKDKENERPFEPLQLWTSPHQGGEPKGLPPQMLTQHQCDEYGVEEAVTVMKPAPTEAYSKQNVFVPPILAKWLRPHQREGVQFLYECVMGLKSFNGQGCM